MKPSPLINHKKLREQAEQFLKDTDQKLFTRNDVLSGIDREVDLYQSYTRFKPTNIIIERESYDSIVAQYDEEIIRSFFKEIYSDIELTIVDKVPDELMVV